MLSGQEKESYLISACHESPDLYNEVQELLQSIEKSDKENFLEPLSRGYQEIIADMGDDTKKSGTDKTFIGKEFGAYRITECIGEGGMGAVYKADRTGGDFHHTVAIKLIKQGLNSKENIRRFKIEREVLAGLNHPNIAQLYDGGINSEGVPYLVMEFVDGIPIDQYCNEHHLTIDERLTLFKDVCSAIQYAHNNLVIHRDLKNQNVFVNRNGVVKILDFGVAKLLTTPLDGSTLLTTQPGQRFWTPQYAAPEQVKGATITTATDIYMLGVLLYKLLTNAYPLNLKEKNLVEIGKAIQEETAIAPSKRIQQSTLKLCASQRCITPLELIKTLDGDLDALILKAIRKEPNYRYHSVGQLLDDLDHYNNNLPLIARNDTVKYRLRKLYRRHKMEIMAVAAFLVLIIGSVTFYSYSITAERAVTLQERDRAVTEAEKAEQVTRFLIELFENANPMVTQNREITAGELLELGSKRAAMLDDQPEIRAQMLHTIGTAFYALGRLDEANSVFQEQTDILRGYLGETHHTVATGINELGWIRLVQGNYADATELFEEAIRLQRGTVDEADPNLAKSLHGLGLALNGEGQTARAEELLKKAIEMRREFFVDDHADLAHVINDMGIIMLGKGDYSSAEEYFRDAITMRENVFGPLHPLVADSRKQLAGILILTGNLTEAEEILINVIENQTRVLEENHPEVAGSYHTLAIILKEMERFDEAALYSHKAVEAVKNLETHFQMLPDMLLLEAELSQISGDIDTAGNLYEEFVQSCINIHGFRSFSCIETNLTAGEFFFEHQQFDKAQKYLQQAYDVMNEFYEPGHDLLVRATRPLELMDEGS